MKMVHGKLSSSLSGSCTLHANSVESSPRQSESKLFEKRKHEIIHTLCQFRIIIEKVQIKYVPRASGTTQKYVNHLWSPQENPVVHHHHPTRNLGVPAKEIGSNSANKFISTVHSSEKFWHWHNNCMTDICRKCFHECCICFETLKLMRLHLLILIFELCSNLSSME